MVQADASEVGLSAVLAQIKEGEEHPVLYLSREVVPKREELFHSRERVPSPKMGPGNTQILPALKEVHSSDGSFSIAMEAKSKETNSRVTRWFLSLQAFNFSVVHRPGQIHGKADALSRCDAL